MSTKTFLYIYSFLSFVVFGIARAYSRFNPKLKLFFGGRNQSLKTLCTALDSNKPTVWFHAPSLGEYEQGLPVLEQLKKTYPFAQFVITFFSPSGFEVIKKKNKTDILAYLPIDNAINSPQFLDVVNPSIIVFVKYDFWPYYMFEIGKRHIPYFLISGNFRSNQIIFSRLGSCYRNLFHNFTSIFVQNHTSKLLLTQQGLENVMVAGDTRFDRVFEIKKQAENLGLIELFLSNKGCMVLGSIYPQESHLFLPIINQHDFDIKYILAPHNMTPSFIKQLQKNITTKSILYSEAHKDNISKYHVLIIDNIGLLSKIYKYATLAYVGGGFRKNGLHNILEPAVYNIPVFIERHYKKFSEAIDLVDKVGGVFPISNHKDLKKEMMAFLNDSRYYESISEKISLYMKSQIGSTQKIVDEISKRVYI